MSVEQVNVGGLQSLQALLNTPYDVVTAEAGGVDVTSNVVRSTLRSQNYLGSVLGLQPLTNYPLGVSVLSEKGGGCQKRSFSFSSWV